MQSPRRLAPFLTCAALSAVALFAFSPSAAADPGAAEATYERLQQGRYGAPVAVPPAGLELVRDTAVWTFSRGELRFMEPTADGLVTGLVFEGEGHFRMTVPDAVERAQLRRVSEEDIESIDEPFTALVLRTTEAEVLAAFPAAPSGGTYEPNRLAADRHEQWRDLRRLDIDARLLCGLLIPNDRYLRIEVETPTFGWLTYEHDGLRREEINLNHVYRVANREEVWVSLDAPQDRTTAGRPAPVRQDLFDLQHVDLEVDLTRASRRSGRVGYGDIHTRRGQLRATLTLMPWFGGARALPLELDPEAEVTAVTSSEGEPLRFLRHETKEVGRKVYGSDLLVLLDRPLEAGETRQVVVEYELELYGYAPGRSWYPGAVGVGIHDPHTARLTITALAKNDVRAMGRAAESREEGKLRHQVWMIDEPERMITFSFSEGFHDEIMEREGVPRIVAFAPTNNSNTVWNVAADVMNSVSYFQLLFDSELPVGQLNATSIPGSHGQSFEGFIHLSDFDIHNETKGPSELFRAHEVAHQWWGHVVAWQSYRDQWLSEAFAEYSAMMFIEATMENGAELYEEIVRTYIGQSLAEVRPSRFLRRSALELNDKDRERIGPISIGYRAATGDAPGGYVAQTYCKGAVVLHMLRTLLRNVTKSDEVFMTVLREFLTTHRGGEASTDDFMAILAKHAPSDWSWFFDQWVHDTAIPTYRWRYETASKPDAEGKYALTLEVHQEDVPEGFRMPVPVAVTFGKGETGQIVVPVNEAEQTFTIPLPKRPKKVELNPDGAVMARVKKL